jgi:hypothetical protein
MILCMQGKERADRQLLNAQVLVGHLVPAGSMFGFLATHRGELFADEDFADLFPSGRGRPSVPASVMASVMVLQVLHAYSDAEAAEAAGVTCGGRWRAGSRSIMAGLILRPCLGMSLLPWRCSRPARSAQFYDLIDLASASWSGPVPWSRADLSAASGALVAHHTHASTPAALATR